MPDRRKSAEVWLVVLVIANGVLAAVLYGGALNRLNVPAKPERPLAENPILRPWICAAWGPFADRISMNALVAEVEAAGGETDLISRRVAATPDYMLLVGPLGSFDSARRVREELVSQSIESRIVPAGPLARSLEVGIFADRAWAEARQARVEELGYSVELKEVERSVAAFYLMARLRRKTGFSQPPSADCGVVAPGHRFL